MKQPRRPRSITFKAFVIVGLIAILQLTGLAVMTATQRDAAHIIDMSGAQRMRTQRIAYLALAAHSHHPVAGWRAELDRTIVDALRVRAQLWKRPELRTGPADPAGRTHAGRFYARYLAAAQRLSRDPSDAAAFATIERDRKPLLGVLDDAVHRRVTYFSDFNQRLIYALVSGLIAQVAVLGIVLFILVLPSERAAAATMEELEESQRQFRSLFAQNPDPIAIFDRTGALVRGNRASRELLQSFEASPGGETFLSHVEPDLAAAATLAFDSALGGLRVAIETTFVRSDGEPIAVDVNLFPWIVRGEITGVIGVAKDVRALRAAEAEAREQSERVAEIYRISAHHEMTWEQQIDETMRLAATRLGYEFAILAEVRDDVLMPVGAYGTEVVLGERVPFESSLSRYAIAARDVWVVDDLADSPYREEPSVLGRGWRSIAVVPLEISGSLYGSLVLGSMSRRAEPLRSADRDYVNIVASLLASEVQRAQHQRFLDSLAFYDHLTGLPNRKYLDRMLDAASSDAQSGDRFALLYLDLDLFKSINDTYGHAAGDEVLRAVGSRMKACVRGSDTVSRIGGDEFLVLQHLPRGRDDARALAQRLLETIGEPLEVDGVVHHLGISIGIAIYGEGDWDAGTLMSRADAALYRAKGKGRNRAEFAADSEGREPNGSLVYRDRQQERSQLGELSA